MKTVNFTYTGGMPLTQNLLAFLQESYSEVLRQIGLAIGNHIILSGTQATGGWAIVDGEVMPFRAGSGSYCHISTDYSYVNFANNTQKPIYGTPYMYFSSSPSSLLWSSFIGIGSLTRPAIVKKESVSIFGGGGWFTLDLCLFSNSIVQLTANNYTCLGSISGNIPAIYAPAHPVNLRGIAYNAGLNTSGLNPYGCTLDIDTTGLCKMVCNNEREYYPTMSYITGNAL